MIAGPLGDEKARQLEFVLTLRLDRAGKAGSN